MEVHEVVSPVGKFPGERRSASRRLDTLDGKTICEVSNGEYPFRCTWSFPIIREMLLKRYPDAKVVPYSDLPTVSIDRLRPETKEEKWAALRSALRENRCEAVISQFGG
jgi:hypothetical protein